MNISSHHGELADCCFGLRDILLQRSISNSYSTYFSTRRVKKISQQELFFENQTTAAETIGEMDREGHRENTQLSGLCIKVRRENSPNMKASYFFGEIFFAKTSTSLKMWKEVVETL